MSNVAQGAQQLLGDGQLFIDLWTGASPAKTGAYRFIGDVKSFGITPTTDIKEAYDHTSGTRRLLSSAVSRVKEEIGFEMTEYQAENLALALLGDTGTPLTQTSGTITAEALGTAGAVVLDRAYQTAKRNISAVTLKAGAAGATSMTLGTDYIIQDASAGLIYIPATSGILPTDTMKIDYTAAAITGSALPQVLAGTTTAPLASLLFLPKPLSGPQLEYRFWKVRLGGDGEVPLITDDFGAFKVKGLILFDGVHTELFSVLKRT